MEDFLGSAGGFIESLGSAYKDAFGEHEGKDKKSAKAELAWNPKMIALILGGVLAAVIVLKLVLSRGR